MDIRKVIEAFDFETASPHDMAVLLEQIFQHHDARCRNGGPIIVAQGVLKRYEEAIRQKAAPEIHRQVVSHCTEMRSTLAQFHSLLRTLEKDNAQTRP